MLKSVVNFLRGFFFYKEIYLSFKIYLIFLLNCIKLFKKTKILPETIKTHFLNKFQNKRLN